MEVVLGHSEGTLRVTLGAFWAHVVCTLRSLCGTLVYSDIPLRVCLGSNTNLLSDVKMLTWGTLGVSFGYH